MEDKQQKLLNAALNLFVSSGFHGTPTSKIASEAGVAHGTLFHYYKTKDELIIALYTDIKTRLKNHIDLKESKEQDAKTRLQNCLTRTVEWALHNQNEFRFAMLFHASPYKNLMEEEALKKLSGSYDKLIREAIKLKIIKPLPVNYINILAGSIINGLFDYMISEKLTAAQQKKLTKQTIEMLWDMIT